MNIVVLGYIVRGPLGGLAWHHLQYVLGLKQSGHNVIFLEDSDDYFSCYNPESSEMSTNPEYGLRFITNLFNNFDLKDQWAYFDAHTNNWYGQSEQKVISFCALADVVLNLSGINPLREWWASIPSRILVDTDPTFTQIKHLTDNQAMIIAKSHTHFATFGENYGKRECSIPDDGLLWRPTRQPVCMDVWHVSKSMYKSKWTTVMQWDSYKVGEYGAKIYGMKSLSFKPFISLPKYIENIKLELALGSPNSPGEELVKEGWDIIDPSIVTKSTKSYQQYIAASKGEWSVAKHGYVITNSGWFSERSLNYMASGKPVVIQDTGFTQFIPSGKGLLPFTTLEQASEQIKKAEQDYKFHCTQARKVAQDFFDSKNVLSTLLSII